MQEHIIDATNKKLGRLASEVAHLLLGKDTTDFKRNQTEDVRVVINNASKLDISAKKRDTKYYLNYSGYPGGQRKQMAKEVIAKKGYGELVRHAVDGMLPKNKLRTPRLKNLVVNE